MASEEGVERVVEKQPISWNKQTSIDYMELTEDRSAGHALAAPIVEATKVYRGHEDAVDSVRWLDQTSFITGSHDHSLKVWDSTSGECVKTLKGSTEGIYNVDVSNDRKLFLTCSAGKSKNAAVWDAHKATLLRHLDGHPSAVYHGAFAPTNTHTITGGKDGSVRVHDVNVSKPVVALQPHSDVVECCRFCMGDVREDGTAAPSKGSGPSPSTNLIATASRDGSIMVMDLGADRGSGAFRIKEAHGGKYVYALLMINPTTIISAGGDYLIRKFDLRMLGPEGNRPSLVYVGHSSPVRSLTVSQDYTRFVSTCADGSARLWKVDEKRVLFKRKHSIEDRVGLAQKLLAKEERKYAQGQEVDIEHLKKLRADLEDLQKRQSELESHLSSLTDVQKIGADMMFAGHKDLVSDCSLETVSDGKALLLTSSWDQTVRLWNVPLE
ncbi:unnamed protein product [Vitrella brassicaformis CCMP3155]|uniref:Anaphase-promoting complex subunit 4 WD40 domain-containing protein n=1 Tax=Vitrella brassicaformis (strain CCMP3155) TaxID=1169540 RepID=A0A0G4FC92_VITBC|nr:unnamed protein product [Vitrella brassicaformis CCMP3155]|eukprot:CEM10818.1 unnamed protein product [Vitrella brassicaformis CCMP3155]